MSKTIVLFKTELDTLNEFSSGLKAGFEELGYDIFEFDLAETVKNIVSLHEYAKSHQVLAMIGFNNRILTMRTSSGINIWETFGIFCINILVDHPYWYHDILMKMPDRSAVLCIDRNHMNYVSRFYPKISVTGFLPHGGLVSNVTKEYDSKDIDVIYAGSLYAYQINELNTDYSLWEFDAQTIVNNTINYLINNPNVTVEAALENELKANGIELPDEELRVFITANVHIERRVSSYYRELLIRNVAESGLELTIYGSGWDNCSFVNLPNVHYKGMVSPREVLDTIARSKVLINSMPWFKDGSHERIFNGMLNGTIVLTEDNAYLSEITKGDECCFTYKLNEESIREACDRLKTVINNKEEYNRITGEAARCVAESHTWKSRAYEIHNDLLSLI